jgi:ubiquinone/menaquinone biosynthesis C-methylase UbiE
MASIGMTKIVPTIDYNYVVGDVTKMPFKDDEFDTVVDTFGLEYVINPTKALEEMRRYDFLP